MTIESTDIRVADGALTEPTRAQSERDLHLHLARSEGQTKAPQEVEAEEAMAARLEGLAAASPPDGEQLPGVKAQGDEAHALERGKDQLAKLNASRKKKEKEKGGVDREARA